MAEDAQRLIAACPGPSLRNTTRPRRHASHIPYLGSVPAPSGTLQDSLGPTGQSRSNVTIDGNQGRQLRWIRLRLHFEGLCKNESGDIERTSFGFGFSFDSASAKKMHPSLRLSIRALCKLGGPWSVRCIRAERASRSATACARASLPRRDGPRRPSGYHSNAGRQCELPQISDAS